MKHETDLLKRVQGELVARCGSLRAVAAGSGVSYDTVRRVMHGTTDPGYSKVVTLAAFFGFVKPEKPKRSKSSTVHRVKS